MVFVDDPDFVLHVGDALDVLAGMPDESVHCVVTSPPYWGLRDYSCDGQLGLEPTPDEYVANMVAVFRQVRRVLRRDGTCWLNIGDSYAANTSGGQAGTFVNDGSRDGTPTKPKDLVGIPWRLAFALQQPYYTGRIKDERDRIWLAAMVDAEGCIHIHKRAAGQKTYSKFDKADGTTSEYVRKNDTFGVMVSIDNTNEAIIQRCAKIVGQGAIYKDPANSGVQQRRQDLHRLTLTGQQSRELLRELYPHLVGKRQEARIAYHSPSSGDGAQAAHEAIKDLHNGRGSSVDYPEPPTLFEPGWYVRSDVIWSKSNPMPESVTDRPTKAHEYLFLLTRSPQYFYDADAIREKYQDGPGLTGGSYAPPGQAPHGNARGPDGRSVTRVVGADGSIQHRAERWPNGGRNKRSVWEIAEGQDTLDPSLPPEAPRGPDGRRKTTVTGGEGSIQHRDGERWPTGGANRRSVWTIATQPYPDAHFATFPQALVEPCVLAGTSERGCCPECGAPWERETSVEQRHINNTAPRTPDGQTKRGWDAVSTKEVTTIGWRPTCDHGHDPIPSTVLDPFLGSGTTALVARRLGRRTIGIELSAEYATLAAERLQQLSLFADA